MLFLSLDLSLDTIHFSQILADSSLLAQGKSQNLPQRIFDEITLYKFFRAAIAVLIAYGGLFGIQAFTDWISEKVPRKFRLLIKQSLPFWKGLILLITVSYLLNLFLNLSQANIFALTGTIAVALGFAFKDYVSSVIAGIIALFEGPYQVGDRIKVGKHYGEVVGYSLRGFRLRTPDDNVVTIPHNKIWLEAISNANSGHLEAQVATDFYFDHTADAEQVIAILYQAAYSSKYTQLKLPIVVVMEEHFWGTQFKLRSYPMDARDEFVYKTDLIRRAKYAFSRHHLPYPQGAKALNQDRGFNLSPDSPNPPIPNVE